MLLDIVADGFCLKKKKKKIRGTEQKKNLPTVPKLDVQMECSRLSSRLTGLEPGGGSKVTTLGPLKRQRCVATKEPQRGGKKSFDPVNAVTVCS